MSTTIPSLLRKARRVLTRSPADPMTRHCPYCHAKPGQPCVNTAWGGIRDEPHSLRAED